MSTTLPDDPSLAVDVVPRRPRRLARRRTVADTISQLILPIVALALLGFAGWYV